MKHGLKLSIEVEAQPVPVKDNVQPQKPRREREKGETSAARRDGAQQGNCHRTKKGESSRLPKNELLTGTLGHRHQPQYQPYRIRAETREGRYWERSTRGGRQAKEPATRARCRELSCPPGGSRYRGSLFHVAICCPSSSTNRSTLPIQSATGLNSFFFKLAAAWIDPGGAPFSQLSSGVRTLWSAFTRLVKCHFMTKTCEKAS